MMFSETTLSGCSGSPGHGVLWWTAGQRVDPTLDTEFIWRTGDACGDGAVFAMRYANWGPGFPNSSGSDLESCVNLFGRGSYVWNDAPCGHASCFVCELDLGP